MNMQQGISSRKRGRPKRTTQAGTTDAKALIVEEARRQFGERGYRDTTLRSVGQGAGVDARLVLHYFGSKRDLFRASVQLPIEPDEVIAAIFAAGVEAVPQRAVAFILSALDDPVRRDAFVGLLRAAVSEPEAADLIRDVLTERILTPIASRVGGDRPELRASMLATQVLGLAIVRYVLRLEPLASASPEQVARGLTPVVAHYLSGGWVTIPE
jgi:AcrR family transcriptional regulator